LTAAARWRWRLRTCLRAIGLDRTIKVLLDLIVVKFLDRYFVRLIYIFGGFGIFSFVLSIVSAVYMLYLKVFEGLFMILTPLPR
jgi:hypothetical protein